MAKSPVAARKRSLPGAVAPAARVRVRMYRQGLGDCFLVTFFTEAAPVHMLIDCGTLGTSNTVTLAKVAANIAETTGNHLDVLIATHEHRDHLSGFASQKAIFDRIAVDHVWLAWTENPQDQMAQDLARDNRDLLRSLAVALGLLKRSGDTDASVVGMREGIERLLTFYGDGAGEGETFGMDFAETVHAAMNYVASRVEKPDYLLPGRLIEADWLPGIRVYILGPPRSREKLRKLGSDASRELYKAAHGLAQSFEVTTGFLASGQSAEQYYRALDVDERVRFERQFPFDSEFRLSAKDTAARKRWLAAYDAPDVAWRRIDRDFLGSATDLALQLDSQTNNTSLVMAIEMVDDGRVLLFPADAQLGNWLSWHDQEVAWTIAGADGTSRVVTASDLLRRTVFYKVGHHSSHNATINAQGLELMASRDLVAMIPVDATVAGNKHWKMPATALYRRLLEKTSGRVLRSDALWPNEADRPASLSKPAWDAARASAPVEIDPGGLFVDFLLR
jgi:hypothetical protein